MKLLNSNTEYHNESDCKIAKIFLRLSSWSFNTFAIEKLPNGYVVGRDFGPRVAKFDWFELLLKFPFVFALLVIPAVAAVLGIFWICHGIKGLQNSRRREHIYCRYLTALLLFFLLLPLVIGLYMTFRANFLLRTHKAKSMGYRDRSNYTELSDIELDNFKPVDVSWNDTQPDTNAVGLENLYKALNKSIAEELIEWQQVMAQSEQMRFEKLNYLKGSQKFYKNVVNSLRDTAYELLILGLEMDDILRAFLRDATTFLRTKGDSESVLVSRLHAGEHLDVWHLHSIYQHHEFLYDFLEYLSRAFLDISKLLKSNAETKPYILTENVQLKAPMIHHAISKEINSLPGNGSHNIPKFILYSAMAMLFLTGGLIYVLLIALGFGIFRYYEEAKSLLKFFICVSLIAIATMAVLTVVHFLLTIVLHTGICHRDEFGDYISAKCRLAEPLECAQNVKTRKDLLTNIARIIPTKNMSYFNATDNLQPKDEFRRADWYKKDMQRLLYIEGYAPFREYNKQYGKENTTKARLFLCKLNLIENTIGKELYTKEFGPRAVLLYETVTKVQKRAQSDGYNSLSNLLEGALNELHGFDKIYAQAKTNFLENLDKKFASEMNKFNKLTRSSTNYDPYGKEMLYTKCACLEDLLMIYAIGGTIIVLSLFLAMLLSMMLFKLYKRGPAIHGSLPPPNTGEFMELEGSTSTGSVPQLRAKLNPKEAQQLPKGSTTVQNKDSEVNLESDREVVPLINTVEFMPPVVSPVGCMPDMCSTPCQPNLQQMDANNHNPQLICSPACQPNVQQMNKGNQNDDIILPISGSSKRHAGNVCAIKETQFVGSRMAREKTMALMVYQSPKDRQPLVTYTPPTNWQRK